ncbi:HpcH/HpaI aldolase/citrate lyase family protein [Thermodesulfobacteriota bacterium]
MRIFRSFLYAAGNQPKQMEKAASSGADALIFDLEDKVPIDQKGVARSITREYIGRLSKKCVIYVRVNSLESGMLLDDLKAVAIDGLEGIRIPKVDSPETVKAVAALLGEVEQAHGLPPGSINLCIGLESARGVHLAYEIFSASSRISTASLGLAKGGDLETDIGYLWSEERTEVLYVRSKVLLAARIAGIPIPMDGGYSTGQSYERSRDEAGLIRDAQLGRSLGYRAKVCLYPGHVEHINQIFTPTTKEIDYSRRVLEAFEAAVTQNSPSTSVDGKLIDDTQVANARKILFWAKGIDCG